MTSCHADTIPTYARAAELAAHRASLALPVAASDAEPLRIPETKAVPTYRPRPKREYERRGRPKTTVPKVAICRRHNAAGETVYAAHVREVGGKVTYVGRFRDKDEATAACRVWIEQGVKPLPKKRGPLLGSRKRQVAERLPIGPVAVPLATKMGLGSQEAPKQAKTGETRLEMIARIAKRRKS